ncbi:DMT family transporter [Pseudomaricurvus sp. HS19]|uniref:DMT family transporter n=1 Tax=Pseudomaricurvus sp. HS19 TaxID=2692626 RepID=UPI00136ABCF4|nr:DMT family transporter [Pseudomaricurvus sp. HS19]MYM62760.1 EamA family transporter [Pseudomaricurvus sp. HS19]
MSTLTNRPAAGILYALASALVGSTAGAAGKLISDDLGPSMIVLIQYSICLIAMLPLLWRNGPAVWRSQRPLTHLLRGIGGWLSFFAYYTALSGIPLVDANLLRNTAPLFVPLVTLIWAGVLVPRSRWLPLSVGFFGVILILQPGHSTPFNAYYLVGLASGALLAVSMVGTRQLSSTESSSTIMLFYFLLSFLLSLPLAILHWQPVAWHTAPYLLYIGISIFLAMWLYTKAYSYAKPSIVSPMSYFAVIFSGLLGWLLWDHLPGALSLAGIALVVSAGVGTVYLGNRTTNLAKDE